MSNSNIEDLFDRHRFPRAWQLIPILLYFPIGLVLSVIRLFIGMNACFAACILPKVSAIRSWILRVMCIVLGIWVYEENVETKNRQAKVIVSNHVSVLDHLAIDLVFPCIVPGDWDIPHVLSWCLGFKDLGIKQGRSVLNENVRKHWDETRIPILAHPEGTTTSGKVGLLKFSSWAFSLDQPVYPIGIRVVRPPIINIAVSIIGSYWWSDLFWFLFTPCTIFTLSYLPEMRKDEGETEEEFSKRVQESIAHSLHLKATPYNSADKLEHIKKLFFVPPAPQARSLSRTSYSEDSLELVRMAQQVKEVLPYVPLEVIKRELFKTKNVDITITNILEGRVPYVSEQSSSGTFNLGSSSSARPSTLSSGSPSVTLKNSKRVSPTGSTSSEVSSLSTMSSKSGDLNTAAATFGKTADERMMSYQERKTQLISSARQRYLEKHKMI